MGSSSGNPWIAQNSLAEYRITMTNEMRTRGPLGARLKRTSVWPLSKGVCALWQLKR